jgi:hypothetical protein
VWTKLIEIELNEQWQYSLNTKRNSYRLTHTIDFLKFQKSIAIIALCSPREDGNGLDIFQPQRIQPYLESEIIRFPDPPSGWQYGVAIKRLLIPREVPTPWKVKLEMPAFNPQTSPIKTTDVVVNSVSVSTVDKIIAPADPESAGTVIMNESKNAQLYLQIKRPATLSDYYQKLGYKGYVEIPFGFTGEIRGFWEKADPTGMATVYRFKE